MEKNISLSRGWHRAKQATPDVWGEYPKAPRVWERIRLPIETVDDTDRDFRFLRDIHLFETLRERPFSSELIQARRAEKQLLNIWSGEASSSGQEPYTIAIILHDYFPELANWKVTFQATDISQDMLNRCNEGCYSQVEVNRGLPAALLMKYFRQEGARWRIRDDLRAMIDFRRLNLAAPCRSCWRSIRFYA